MFSRMNENIGPPPRHPSSIPTLYLKYSALFLFFGIFSLANGQCPQLQPPCRCAPSIYEPVAIICENAGSLANAIQAIQPARDIPVRVGWQGPHETLPSPRKVRWPIRKTSPFPFRIRFYLTGVCNGEKGSICLPYRMFVKGFICVGKGGSYVISRFCFVDCLRRDGHLAPLM